MINYNSPTTTTPQLNILYYMYMIMTWSLPLCHQGVHPCHYSPIKHSPLFQNMF